MANSSSNSPAAAIAYWIQPLLIAGGIGYIAMQLSQPESAARTQEMLERMQMAVQNYPQIYLEPRSLLLYGMPYTMIAGICSLLALILAVVARAKRPSDASAAPAHVGFSTASVVPDTQAVARHESLAGWAGFLAAASPIAAAISVPMGIWSIYHVLRSTAGAVNPDDLAAGFVQVGLGAVVPFAFGAVLLGVVAAVAGGAALRHKGWMLLLPLTIIVGTVAAMMP